MNPKFILFWWKLATVTWGSIAVLMLFFAWHLAGTEFTDEGAFAIILAGMTGFLAHYSWRQWR